MVTLVMWTYTFIINVHYYMYKMYMYKVICITSVRNPVVDKKPVF